MSVGAPETTRHVGTRCKRKQYDGVRVALQFLCPLLTAWQRRSAQAEAGTDDTDNALIRSVTETGVPATLSHSGPITFQHLGILRDPAWSALMRSIFAKFPLSALSPEDDSGGFVNLFPAPAVGGGKREEGRSGALWTEGLVARYTATLAEVHRSHPSRNLREEGYLHEAGLLMRRLVGECDDLDAHQSARWTSLIDAYTLGLPDRSHVHELENVPQEVMIGELLVQCLAKRGETPEHNALDLVVDVGGGNGFLAAEVGERLRCDSLVMDPFFPSHSIDCCPRVWADRKDRERPAALRQHRLSRVMTMFGDTHWDTDIAVDPLRCALIAKHLCGTAIDACLTHLDQQQRLPRILVLVPCCFNKGTYEEYVNKEFLHRVLHVQDADAYGNMARLTDWNASLYQKLASDGPSNGSRYSPIGRDKWGNCSKRSMRHLVSCAEVLAQTVEACLNRGRMCWLEERGYTTELREYVPDCVTPKNKCIVAYRKSSS